MLPLVLLFAAAQAEPSPDVSLFRFSGEDGTELRDRTNVALRESFGVRVIALDHDMLLERLSCEALDAACIRSLGRWLASDIDTASDYAVIEVAGPPRRSIWVCDVNAGTVIEKLEFREDTGDQILPIVVPARIAQAVREHHQPPPPITEAERAELDGLDERPAATVAYEDLPLCPCLSVSGPEFSLPNCRDAELPPPVGRKSRCSVQTDEPPAPLFLLLALLALRERRKAVLERLSRSGRLPADVAARLRATLDSARTGAKA